MNRPQDRFYRVSAKALVVADDGKVLVCKEDQPHWSLPGGGVDHGEQPLQALMRELEEELGVKEIVSAELSSAHTFEVPQFNSWFMWLVYKVVLPDHGLIVKGLVEDVDFVLPEQFANSDKRSEKLVYAAWREATKKQLL